MHRQLHWDFPDPSALKGTYEERLAGTRLIRDTIKAEIINFIGSVKN
jgi:arsenate reductase